MSNSDIKNCVRCNATEGSYDPNLGWHFCGSCADEHRENAGPNLNLLNDMARHIFKMENPDIEI